MQTEVKYVLGTQRTVACALCHTNQRFTRVSDQEGDPIGDCRLHTTLIIEKLDIQPLN
jgi:hypothetical protein